MTWKNAPYLFLVLFIFAGCSKEDVKPITSISSHDPERCEDCEDHENSNIADKIFFVDGDKWLWGGENDDWHFNINNLSVNTNNLKFGLGRELFEALLEPTYEPLEEVEHLYDNDDEFIIIHAKEGIKAFPLNVMSTHEVINDVIDGMPIMIGYCVLADFSAVYSRDYCGETITFAVSGYTYYEEGIRDGRDGFVLWDRDTESLWWPLIDKAISGPLKGANFLKEVDFDWENNSFEYLKNNFSDVQILASGQTMDIPQDWQELNAEDFCN